MKQELSNNMNIQKLFDEQRKAVGEMAKELAEREFEIFEFNLFISSAGKKRLDKISSDVKELREKVDKGEIDLSQYYELAEEF